MRHNPKIIVLIFVLIMLFVAIVQCAKPAYGHALPNQTKFAVSVALHRPVLADVLLWTPLAPVSFFMYWPSFELVRIN